MSWPIKHDAEFKYKGELLKNESSAHSVVGEYVETLRRQLSLWLHSGLHCVDFTVRTNMMLLVADMGKELDENIEMQ